MPSGFISDYVGNVYGRLTVIKKDRINNRTYLSCECECGTIKSIRSDNVVNGKVLSCGCLNAELTKERSTKHGKSYSRMYKRWSTLKNRCHCKTAKHYPRYGGRGITLCDEWLTFKGFYNHFGGLPDGIVIDRIDNNGPYSPGNTQLLTRSEHGSKTAVDRKLSGS